MQDAGLRWLGLDPALLRLRSGLATVALAVPGIATAVVTLVLSGPVQAGGVVLVALALLGLVFAVLRRQFRAWGYAEREDDLVVRRGVMFRRTSVVPYGRMQFVDVTAGPFDRRLGLASVVLHTAAAASVAKIPGLAAAEAERLRDRLAALGEARQAGL